jgi:ATP-dependent DNA helicase RecQ
VASFNRPNLHYIVEPKKKAFERLVTLVRGHTGQSGIVYCGTRAGTENIAERLRAAGFKAASYHAGMETRDRAATQEAFLHDRVDIICATIAFGMGVNKPNIRFVVHYDLPKNIESYYQETGRAGRDGDPADCLLLFGPGDLITHERRIDEKTSAHEREIARQQLEAIMAFAESRKCRRRALLNYFGENYGPEKCGACDNCTGRSKIRAQVRPDGEAAGPTEDRTQDARRFIACLDEITRTSFSVGAGWVTDVLAGTTNEKIKQRGHGSLKTFGRGRAVSKTDWAEIARELVRLDLVRRNPEKHYTLEITPSGRDFALSRTEATVAIRPSRTAAPDTYDEALFDRLRQLRRRIADERQAPAFTVFSDVALRQMASDYPESPDSFIRISGVGQSKLRDHGDEFMKEISDHVRTNGKKQIKTAPVEDAPVAVIGRSERESLNMFLAGNAIERICEERSLKTSTVYGHLALCAEAGEEIDLNRLASPEEQKEIAVAATRLGWANLTAIREDTGDRFEYGVLRVCRALIRRRVGSS